LNWENPNLRNEVYDIMRFGLTKESMVLEWMLFNLFQRQQLELPKEIINKPVEIIKYYGNGTRPHDYGSEMHMTSEAHENRTKETDNFLLKRYNP
jgi:oligo-1,6-glucosidase